MGVSAHMHQQKLTHEMVKIDRPQKLNPHENLPLYGNNALTVLWTHINLHIHSETQITVPAL